MFQRSLLSIYLLSLLYFFIVFVLLCFVLFCFIYLFVFYFLGGGGGVGFVVELNKFRANKCKQSKGKESDPTSSLSKVL